MVVFFLNVTLRFEREGKEREHRLKSHAVSLPHEGHPHVLGLPSLPTGTGPAAGSVLNK